MTIPHANARLIKDAPDLLTAAYAALLGLESALRTAKASVSANDQYATAAATQVTAYERKIERLRAAIAKAEGTR